MRDPLEEAGVETSRPVATGIFVAVLAGLVGLGIFAPGSRTPLLLVLGLVLLVMLHEAGHFLAARRCGMKATEFFVGFGPRLWSFRRGETEYGVKALPLGGYVRIIGMTNLDEVDPADEPRAFRNGRARNRMIVILAGVTVNLLLALALIWVAIAGRGWVNDGPSTSVDALLRDAPAAVAGIEPGDRIVRIEGQRVRDWDSMRAAIEPRAGEPTTLTVRRDGETVEVTATPRFDAREGVGKLGVYPASIIRSVNAAEAAPETFTQLGTILEGTVNGFGHLFSPDGVGQLADNVGGKTPEAGTREDLERPRSIVGIVDQGSSAVDGDLWGLLYLLGALSFALAFLNLIPLVPLDGGHAAVVAYESIATRVRGRRVQADYRRLTPIAVATLLLLAMVAIPTMIVDTRQAIGR